MLNSVNAKIINYKSVHESIDCLSLNNKIIMPEARTDSLQSKQYSRIVVVIIIHVVIKFVIRTERKIILDKENKFNLN